MVRRFSKNAKSSTFKKIQGNLSFRNYWPGDGLVKLVKRLNFSNDSMLFLINFRDSKKARDGWTDHGWTTDGPTDGQTLI